MKRQTLQFSILLTAIFSVSGSLLAGQYSGGIGTQFSPYQISSVADWMELTMPTSSSDWDEYFILTQDIDFEGAAIIPIASDMDLSTDGFQETAFTGVIDGGGHLLQNFWIGQPDRDYVGLFGYIGDGAEIKNMGLKNATIIGNIYVGGLCGSINSSTFSACYFNGTIALFARDTCHLPYPRRAAPIHLPLHTAPPAFFHPS